MPFHNSGIQTKQDALCIQFSRPEIEKVIADLKRMSVTELRSRYSVGEDGRDWRLAWAKQDVLSSKTAEITPIAYRPFDNRWSYYTGNSKGFIAYPRDTLSRHLLAVKNVALCTLRQTVDDGFRHVIVVSQPNEANILISHHVSQQTFPLYVFEDDLLATRSAASKEQRRNFSGQRVDQISERLRLTHLLIGRGDLVGTLGPEDIFHYIYAVLHCPTYRSRYAEFLKIDFPRVPLPGSLELFRELARLGRELVGLHLLESPALDRPLTKFVGAVAPVVEKVSFANQTVWLDKAQSSGFRGVSEAVWNFHIGGYQVCQKWLKDRKGRPLSAGDIAHYHKIVVALTNTIRLMSEIDEVINQHGGWPDAFASASPPPDSSQTSAAE